MKKVEIVYQVNTQVDGYKTIGGYVVDTEQGYVATTYFLFNHDRDYIHQESRSFSSEVEATGYVDRYIRNVINCSDRGGNE